MMASTTLLSICGLTQQQGQQGFMLQEWGSLRLQDVNERRGQHLQMDKRGGQLHTIRQQDCQQPSTTHSQWSQIRAREQVK